MLAPILPSPIIPSCIQSSGECDSNSKRAANCLPDRAQLLLDSERANLEQNYRGHYCRGVLS